MFDPEDNTWVPPEDVATKCPMGDGGKPVCVPRAHFDTFLWSFITVFQILSGENWNAVMYDGMRSTGWPACFYFMTVMIIGNFVVLNLFLAILMASFDNERQKMAESREAEKKAKKVEDDAGPGGSKEAWGEEPSSSQGPIGVVPSGPEASASPRPKAQPRRGSVQSILANLGFGKQRDGSTKSTMGIMDAVKELAERSGFQQRCGSKSLFLFEEGSSIREAAIGLVTNPRFDHVIMVMIAASSLLMAVENPLMDPNSTTVKVLEVFNLLFTLIFLLEMVVKMIAMGVFCGQGEQPAYLGSAWNILDGAICIVSVTDTVQTFSNLASSGGIIAVMKVFRVVRMLRPLRLISRNENLKMVVKTVLGSVPELGKLLAFSSLFFVIFALLGVSNFRGSFFSCKNSALGEYSYDRGLGVTPLCIPNSTVLSLAAPGSLESMQFVALESDSGCPADFDQWRRPTVDTPVCEVHCDSDRGASNTFCQNKTRGPWGYHIMRCTDCSSSFCSEDPGKRSSCTSYCDRHEFFCTDKAAQGRSECLTQCVAQCMCEFSCVGLIQDAALCVEQGGRWVNMNQNFDDVIVGMISLFEISTTEGWVDMMLASVDSTGPYKQPRRDENEVLGTLLFVAFILIGSFFVLNLCVGVIIDNYQKQKDLQQRLMVTSAQEEWMTYLKALYLKKTFFTQVNIASLGPSRQHRYRIISSPNFENFILACIVMNTIALTMVWQPRATGEVEKVLSLVNLLFIAVFHFEAFMKISALHLNYFREFWNLFDFTCVLAGDIVSIAQASAGADGSANLGSLVSALRQPVPGTLTGNSVGQEPVAVQWRRRSEKVACPQTVKTTVSANTGPSFEKRLELAVQNKKVVMQQTEKTQRERIKQAMESGHKKQQLFSPLVELLRAPPPDNETRQAQKLDEFKKEMAATDRKYRVEREALLEKMSTREPLFKLSDVSAAQDALAEAQRKRKVELEADEKNRWKEIEEVKQKALLRPTLCEWGTGGLSFEKRQAIAVAKGLEQLKQVEKEQRDRIKDAMERGIRKSQEQSPLADQKRMEQPDNVAIQAAQLEERRRNMARVARKYNDEKEAIMEKLRNREPLFKLQDVAAATSALQQQADARKRALQEEDLQGKVDADGLAVVARAVLLVLLIYLYAVLGVSLFAKVEYTGVGVYSETVNFRSFFKAVGVLIRSMTGEGWNEIMHDLSKGEFFYQSVLGLRCEVPMDFGSTPFSELDRDGDGLVDNPTECGTPLAYVYFISYTCIVTFVILNLFIAVIFEGFEESKSNEVSNFVQQCLDNWARYDRFNTMALPLGKALDFIDETVDDLLSKIPPIKRCMLEKRWDPNSSTDLFASEAMWALYNMKYVRTLGLTIRPDESVRLVVAMRAVIRRYLVSSTPAGKMLIGFEKRSKVEELEVLEQMLQDTNSPKELQDLRLLELDQSRHINYVLKLEQSTFNRFFGRSAGPSPVEEQRPSNRRMSWFQQMLATKPCCFVVHSARSVLIMGLFSIACFIRSMLFLAVFIVYLYLLCECFLYCCVFAVLFVCLGLTDLVTAAICRCLVCITACVVVVTIPVSLLSLSC
ncbi:unnamed protein product [Polarella glacialis]|uniref:Ion transport domain-containing protein n=1 Tax=Polarella glacialis TaxID=89957 RepID=A0A813D1Z0_POLGL|nr:unnamed protein product [Polarella glacialis]